MFQSILNVNAKLEYSNKIGIKLVLSQNITIVIHFRCNIMDFIYNYFMSDNSHPTPENILRTGFSFWSSKVLLTAVEFDLFTTIAKHKAIGGNEVKQTLGLKCSDRFVFDFLDSLVSLGFLDREGLLEKALYSNTRDTDFFLDKNKSSYIGGILELSSSTMYPLWGNLGAGLRQGKKQIESKEMEDTFGGIYQTSQNLKTFVNGMGGFQAVNFKALAQKFDFSKISTLVDIGGSGAKLSLEVAKEHAHIRCTTLDLPPVEPIARVNIDKENLGQRIQTGNIDFFKESFPKSDVVTMGNILHDWDLDEKKLLIKKAYEALNENGAFIAIESVIDDDRRQNAFGIQMSLNMLLYTNGGFDYTFREFTQWAEEAGFKRTELIHLNGPVSAAVAYK